MKYRSGPLNTVKLLFKPPERRYRFLCARRADLISLISEMEQNRRLQAAPWQIDPGASIGHVHLKVSDLERSVKFYTEILGFEVTTRMGRSAAFLSAGGYHHHLALNTWDSEGGPPPPAGSSGLYHLAILMPNRKELARSLKRLTDPSWPIDGAADHGVSESIYLRDPDQNGIEVYA